MSWNKEKNIIMMEGLASKGIFESKSGSWGRVAIWQNIADNLNNFEKLAVTELSLRDHFTTLMKKYKSKTRQESKVQIQGVKISLKMGNFLKRDLKKVNVERQQIFKKRLFEESSRNGNKSNRTIWRDKKIDGQDESNTGDTKNNVETVVRKPLVFFEKNLSKIVNLDQKTCKEKTMKGSSEKTAYPAHDTTNA